MFPPVFETLTLIQPSSYGVHRGDVKMSGPADHEKRDGIGWEEKVNM